jgi:hypothetical protein
MNYFFIKNLCLHVSLTIFGAYSLTKLIENDKNKNKMKNENEKYRLI